MYTPALRLSTGTSLVSEISPEVASWLQRATSCLELSSGTMANTVAVLSLLRAASACASRVLVRDSSQYLVPLKFRTRYQHGLFPDGKIFIPCLPSNCRARRTCP